MNFKQEFQNLLLKRPRYNVKQVNAENCDYADTAVKSKNCYYSFCVFYCEDVYYSRYSRKCQNSSDLSFCLECQWCRECVDCVNCYGASYSKNCSNCSEVSYCTDCYSCENCYYCIGLYRKKYCISNQQFTKDEYEKKVATMDIRGTVLGVPILGIHQYKTENCIGDNLSESKNCYQCFDSFSMEDCLYNIECNGNKDCVDMTVCFESELCYSCVQSPLNYNCNFLLHSDGCSDSEFCAYSKNLKNCFGCAYLANKEYHILNRKYSPDEYHAEVARIKQEKHSMSLYFVSDYEANRIANEEDSAIQSSLELFNNNQMANTCKNCGNQFAIIAQEMKFYEIKKLPPPDCCPQCRHRQRMALRNERKLYKRDCDKCKKSMLTTYPSSVPYQVYCQKCFWENITA